MSAEPDSGLQELESAWLYRRLAHLETDPRKRELFVRLADAAERQAARWAEAHPATPAPHYRPRLRARLAILLAAWMRPDRAGSVLMPLKVRGLSVYRGRAPAIDGHAMPIDAAHIGARHSTAKSGNTLRAAVFGVSDGLVSNAALILGMAGTGASPQTLALTGVSGLLAGALSMAAGEYLSVRSQRELNERQIALERAEVEQYPEEEAEELALIYAARGIPLEQAREFCRELFKRPAEALEVLVREELGLDPDELVSPWRAATASFVSFSVGAAIPLLPFLLPYAPFDRFRATLFATAAGLLAVGSALSLLTGRSALHGALRMLLIGGGAGATAWLIGHWIGGVLPP